MDEEGFHSRLTLLALDSFLDEWRSAGEVASELLRRECLIKDFKYVRPALEHLPKEICDPLLALTLKSKKKGGEVEFKLRLDGRRLGLMNWGRYGSNSC